MASTNRAEPADRAARPHPVQLSARVRESIAAATQFDGTPPLSDQALLAVAQGRRTLFELDYAVGVLGEGELDLVVRPSARGRGIGRRLLHQMLAIEDQHSGAELRAWAHGENPAATSLLVSAGFQPVRELLRLALDPGQLDTAIAAARPLPDGFTVVPFDITQKQQATDWVRVNAAAFAAHPEQGSVSAADFAALTGEPWFRPEELRLGYCDQPTGPAELAGFTWIKTVRSAADTETELYVLGVDPKHAGRGLGAALLGETLRRMALQHPDRITLYVDGDNSNAVALYLRAGFQVEQRSVQYLRRATNLNSG